VVVPAEGSRRFPPPWRADKIAGGFVVREANGQALAYVYSRENEDEARQARALPTMRQAFDGAYSLPGKAGSPAFTGSGLPMRSCTQTP
jgi:hypothetical protein